MSKHGKIGEFDPEQDDWELYVERMNFYFVANNVTQEAKKKAILLTEMGGKAYQVIRNLLVPSTPGETTFNQIVTLMQEHTKPPPSVIVQRFKFNTRDRQPNESIANFMAALREIAQYCNYGSTLDEMLRDRLVSGVQNAVIQKKLLAEKDLTFKSALEIALALEIADKNARELAQSTSMKQAAGEENNSVNFLPNSRGKFTQQATLTCYRCGGNHRANDCKFKDYTCRECQKKCHLARKCNSRRQPNRTKPVGAGNSANLLDDQSEVDDEGVYSMHLYTVTDTKVKPYEVNFSINGQEVCMEIDTGTGVTVVNEQVWANISTGTIPRELSPSKLRLKTYTGEEISVQGEAVVPVIYQGVEYQLPIVVVAGATRPLLGRNWLQVITLNWSEIFLVRPPIEIPDFQGKYPELFQGGLGTLAEEEAKIYIDPNTKPIFCKARPVPYLLREKIEQSLNKLVAEGTLTPV